jgi:hypothetical protein
MKAIGDEFLVEGLKGNDPKKTGIPSIRAHKREEIITRELRKYFNK